MKTAGIVAEYNPFHNGHQHHIEETKKQTGADYVIAVMSGDFVQRGAPAFLDKYDRAYAALAGGCDLVLELPVIYSSASAEFFASGAVLLLDSLGVCDYLSFGSEEGNLHILLQLAKLLMEEPVDYQQSLRLALKSGHSFPAAREKALEKYFSSGKSGHMDCNISAFLKGPNNILALEYLKALHKCNSSIEPITILRKNSAYHDKELFDEISSASAIRHHILQGQDVHKIASSVPEATFHSVRKAKDISKGFPDFDTLSVYLHSALLNGRDPSVYVDWDKDLANRLLQLPWASLSFSQTADQLKSRNVTHSRVHRALLHYILGMKKELFDCQYNRNPIPYARILGFRKESSLLIKEINKYGRVPLITKPVSIHSCLQPEDKWVWDMDLTASRLYQSIQSQYFGNPLPSAYERTPVIFS